MFIKATNRSSVKVRIMATQIVGWEEMNNNIVRVKTTDGHYVDLDVDIKAFDDAVMQLAGSSEPVDLTN